MKTTFKKYALGVYAVAGLLSTFGPLEAQTVKIGPSGIHLMQNGNEVILCKDSSATMTLFEGRLVEGKTYLHWNVAGQRVDGTYLVYRSCDQKNYELLGYKDGTGVEVKIELAYYFTDETPLSGSNYYVLVHIGDDKTLLTSKVISIENREDMFISKATIK